jgi:transposase-like protein
MVADRLGALGELRTLDEMTAAFADEDRCRDVLEALVWPNGAVCPFCSGRNGRRRGGQDHAKGRWRCGEGACRASFTVTSRTPLHATKLPLSIWLKGLWLVLWSDKGVSSPRLAELLGVTQATAWLLGHRLRLLMRHLNQPLDGTVEADLLQVGGKPVESVALDRPGAARGAPGQAGPHQQASRAHHGGPTRGRSARRGRGGPRAWRRRRGPRPGPGGAGRARLRAMLSTGC